MLAVFACVIALNAHARVSLKACIERASMDSVYYPMRIDADTTITGVSCREEGGRVILIYDNKLESPKSKLPKNAIENHKVATRNMLCTNPQLKALLQLVDMEYVFYDSANVFVGIITHRIEDCGGQ